MPLNKLGIEFKNNKYHVRKLFGIQMLFVGKEYRRMGIASSLLNYHIKNIHQQINIYIYLLEYKIKQH